MVVVSNASRPLEGARALASEIEGHAVLLGGGYVRWRATIAIVLGFYSFFSWAISAATR